jgi:ribose transport system substrate-binding protein
MGARKAFQGLPESNARDRWLSIPFIGCDGMPKTGQAWVRNGLLAATVIVPANSGQALELLVRAVQSGTLPAERTLTVPLSYPAIEKMNATQVDRARAMSV